MSKESFRVSVTNLPAQVTAEMLKEEFSKAGKVTGVLLPKSAKYAYVDFSSASEVDNAISKLNNHLLNGTAIRVENGNKKATAV